MSEEQTTNWMGLDAHDIYVLRSALQEALVSEFVCNKRQHLELLRRLENLDAKFLIQRTREAQP